MFPIYCFEMKGHKSDRGHGGKKTEFRTGAISILKQFFQFTIPIKK